MGLTCSLLGHDRGDPETERDREERGEEVVVVTREVRTCSRCGDRTVVSENTEVRPAGGTESEPADPGEEERATGAAGAGAGTPGGETESPDRSAAEDDGVILEDDGERAPGEWPSAADTRVEDPPADVGESPAREWPDEGPGDDDTEDARAEAATEDDGAAVVEADAAAPNAAEAAEAAETTEETAAAEPDAESVADVTDREWPDEGPSEETAPESTGIAAAGPAGTAEGGDTVFVCPSCDFRERSAGSSHRSGDICPECQQGYLAERTRN